MSTLITERELTMGEHRTGWSREGHPDTSTTRTAWSR